MKFQDKTQTTTQLGKAENKISSPWVEPQLIIGSGAFLSIRIQFLQKTAKQQLVSDYQYNAIVDEDEANR